MTVAIGKLSFAARKDIRKGISWMSLMAFSALFEVSLLKLDISAKEELLQTHERHQRTVITFSENSYTIFFAFSGDCLGFSRNWERRDDILGMKVFMGAKMFLLYISAQISNPPSIHRFLGTTLAKGAHKTLFSPRT